MGKIDSRRLKSIAIPVMVLVSFFGLWEFLVKLFNVNRITLPAPSDIWAALLLKPEYLLSNFGVTALESFLGFLTLGK